MTSRDQLLEAIAEVEAEIARLDQTRQQAAFALEKLRSQLAVHDDAASKPFTKFSPSQEKVQLFADLFRSRDDVFARLRRRTQQPKKVSFSQSWLITVATENGWGINQ